MIYYHVTFGEILIPNFPNGLKSARGLERFLHMRANECFIKKNQTAKRNYQNTTGKRKTENLIEKSTYYPGLL